ncbi:MAG: heavy metal translocating P-type ATPase [Acidobacteriaceae bacterium]
MNLRIMERDWWGGSAANMGIALGIALGMLSALVAGKLLHAEPVAHWILLVAIIGCGLPLGADLIREVIQGNFSVDILAALSISTAIILHQYWVAAIVILMLSGGKALEEYATGRASSVLGALAKRMPQIAHHVAADGALTDIPIGSIAVDDTVMIYPHEICPVDGQVLQGHGSMDESYLTGEPFQIEKAPGTTVLSGAINGNTALTIKATRIASDSRYAKIVEVLHASEQNRPKIRRIGDRIGSWYTPIAVAIALASWLLSGQAERFLAVLVIATPCPLLIAIPIAVIGAISVGARNGIIIKNPSLLEKVDSCKILIVDKTGTLTYGKPQLTEIIAAEEFSKTKLLQMAASLERYSKHPLAGAVMEAAGEEHLPLLDVSEVSESPGTGLTGLIEGRRMVVTGRGRLSQDAAGALPPMASGLECVLMVDGRFAGLCRFQDRPRSESKSFLKHLGTIHAFKKIILLSGDRPKEVEMFASKMGITDVYGGMSPEQKVEVVRQQTLQGQTLFLGDGINDAPAMLTATAGVALGVNSDITSEAAGAVILQSSLQSVDELVHIGRRMRRIALTSAVGGMVLSLAGMAAAAAGYLTPIEGAISQEVIDLLAILNSLRMILPTGPLSDFNSIEHDAN